MTNDEINKYIHTEIMGKCWHESSGVGTIQDGGYYCLKCGDSNALAPFPAEWQTDGNGNPDYCSDESPRSLLNEVEQRVLESVSYDDYSDAFHVEVAAKYISAEQIARACVEAWKSK